MGDETRALYVAVFMNVYHDLRLLGAHSRLVKTPLSGRGVNSAQRYVAALTPCGIVGRNNGGHYSGAALASCGMNSGHERHCYCFCLHGKLGGGGGGGGECGEWGMGRGGGEGENGRSGGRRGGQVNRLGLSLSRVCSA